MSKRRDEVSAGSKPSARAVRLQQVIGPFTGLAILFGLVGLPIAAWLDLRSLSEQVLTRQARETGRVIDNMRAFYANDVVDRVLKADKPITTTHLFRGTPNAIPIPATLSIELGRMISADNEAVKYRFVSDLPFAGRETHPLDDFETRALASLREDVVAGIAPRAVSQTDGMLFDRRVRVASPVLMKPVCVTCHNSHPDSPRRDWKVGDVRGIQEIAIEQPIAANLLSFKYLLGYFALSGAAGAGLLLMQHRQSGQIASINRELSESNDFLADVSAKIARYLSPQIYRSIFSGARDVAIATERKKLTIFFSDIKDFTATTERLQPEELTGLLNEYLTEMSAIALAHGATVDKFIGDAILGFFGDPETKGVKEDALACVQMAVAMQKRLAELNLQWRKRGIEKPFKARIGINTGYCNVGNFGSDDRMDYTIVGAEANLSARLQAIAEPGAIVLSYETYSLVREFVDAQAQSPIHMKGISREIVPYRVKGLHGESTEAPTIYSVQSAGLDFYLDLDAIDPAGLERARRELAEALGALNRKAGAAEPTPLAAGQAAE